MHRKRRIEYCIIMANKNERGKYKMSEFDKIIGYKDVKNELVRLCDIVKNGEKYRALGVAPVGGLLLDGEPGLGKTLMANCFIKESGRKVYVCRKNKPDGEFVNEIKNTFFEAMENAPSIILLDDMDKFANEDNNHRNAEEYVTVQSCIDEVKGKDVFVIATTNGTDNLPKSLLRAGRFDTIIEVKAPEGQDAADIIKYYLSTKKTLFDVNAEDVARIMNGKSCAALETVINIAGQYAVFADKEYIDMDDITRACLRVIYKAPESSAPHNKTVLEKIAYHEAGHTVAAEMLESGSVDLVTVRKNTGSVGGLTCYHSPDDYWVSKKHMENRVIAILAGKAATEIVFGETDTGANNDLNRAFDVVSRFADEYCAYGFGYWVDYGTSEAVKAKKDERIVADMEHYYIEAKKILIKNRVFLDMLAKKLQEKDTLVYSEIKAIKEKAV